MGLELARLSSPWEGWRQPPGKSDHPGFAGIHLPDNLLVYRKSRRSWSQRVLCVPSDDGSPFSRGGADAICQAVALSCGHRV